MASNTLINYLESGSGNVMNRRTEETYLAGEAIAAGAFVSLDVSQTGEDRALYVAELDAADMAPVGVALHAAASGEKVRVCIKGICSAKVDGSVKAIAAGDALYKSAAAGVGEAYTDATGSNLLFPAACALEASTAAESIEVYVK